MATTEVTPGVYKHFRGTYYRVVGIGFTVDKDQPYVIYHNTRSPAVLHLRELTEFTEFVVVDNKKIPRFERIEDTQV